MFTHDVKLGKALSDDIEFQDFAPEQYEGIKSTYRKNRIIDLATTNQFDRLELAKHVLQQGFDVIR